jgi:UDP-N-acetylmuramoylalanine-D-glutamate ligase
MKQNIVVIGAGINGLVAAHYLRKAGCQVNPLFPALRSAPTAVSGTSRQKQIPSSATYQFDFTYSFRYASGLTGLMPGGGLM